ncbi:hypothetical protein [Agromyces lapidis]|uniref:Uncharacterized protein n=1 Tax=Agromyces lapidis TaxID=279574 RepID=A0ABV5ST06_9MICO|nr:hypothetical protein [Agromyces lapidis]
MITAETDVSTLGPFAIDHVVASELPASLGTSGAPERYVVTAVFTRRPDPLELEMLAAAGLAEQLAADGYPGITLMAADRRLLIGNTNLLELESGLAQRIGEILAEIGTQVATLRRTRDLERARLAEQESDRAAAIVKLANRISFDPHSSTYR